MSNGKNGKGFSALSPLTSDLDEAVAEHAVEEIKKERGDTHRADGPQSIPHTAAPTPTRAAPPESHRQGVVSGSSRSPTSSLSGARLFWGLVGIVVLTWLISVAQEDSRQPSRSPSDAPSGVSRGDAPSAAAETRLSDLAFSMPPVGDNNVLSVSQIRWCLRQDILIEVVRPVAASNSQVDRFNAIVAHYNDRCGSFRYREGTLTRAQREVERVRAQIVASARTPW